MLHDIHSHTFHSFCGRDDPHLTVQAAIDGGLELFGISDHNYGVTRDGRAESIGEYLAFLTSIRDEYADKIRIVRGIELCTIPDKALRDDMDISGFDFCLVENIDHPESVIKPDEKGVSGIFAYSERLKCRTGIAHSNLFRFAQAHGIAPIDFFTNLARYGIFWEMNVSYDSIHSYREHQYVKDFMASEEQQDIIRRSGIEISVGFDGHRVEDYRADRVKDCCIFLEEHGIKTVSL